MQSFDSVRELGNGKRFNTGRTNTMCVNNGPDDNSAKKSHETEENKEADIRILTKEEVNEQIRNLIGHSQDSEKF